MIIHIKIRKKKEIKNMVMIKGTNNKTKFMNKDLQIILEFNNLMKNYIKVKIKRRVQRYMITSIKIIQIMIIYRIQIMGHIKIILQINQ